MIENQPVEEELEVPQNFEEYCSSYIETYRCSYAFVINRDKFNFVNDLLYWIFHALFCNRRQEIQSHRSFSSLILRQNILKACVDSGYCTCKEQQKNSCLLNQCPELESLLYPEFFL